MAGDPIRLAPATSRSSLRQMLDQYLGELKRYGEVDSRYPWFDAYWDGSEPRWAYELVDRVGRVAGFALVNTHAPTGRPCDYSMAEFYVLPDKRGRGVGAASAIALFDAHPGTWELAAFATNGAAVRFWRSTLGSPGIEGLEVSRHDDQCVFRFVRHRARLS